MGEMQYSDARELFHRYEIDLSEKAFRLLAEYAALLLQESEVQNVTAVRTEDEIWTRHFLDSAYTLRDLPDCSRIIDIGTGGGVPGIPLSILNPTLNITLLDSELRKIEFCNRCIQALYLRAEAICGRAEELAHEAAYREQFDFAVSRAMASGTMLSELALPFVRIGGRLIAMKGRGYDPSFERFESAAPVLGGVLLDPIPYELEGEQKTLIIVDKAEQTDAKYPRRFAKIKRNPL